MKGKSPHRILLLVVMFLLVVGDLFAYAKICENLAKKLQDSNQEILTVIVGLKEPNGSASFKQLPNNIRYRKTKISGLMSRHVAGYDELLNFINKNKDNDNVYEATPLWISNAIIVRVTKSFIAKLANKEGIESIHLSRVFHIGDVIREYENVWGDENGEQDQYTYGLQKMNIPKVAENFPEITGSEVRVGHIDTGANAEHPDLAGKIIAFKDFIGDQPDPYDDNDHGTHTAGTIAGGSASGTRIGVAPNVGLIVAKVFDKNGSGDEGKILEAMQWIADPDGNPETNDGPIVVSNSWGGPQGTTEQEKPLWDAVKNWVSLGLFPCFATGNEGPNPNTIGTPGGYPHSFAVGATDEEDKVASFSSRGPIYFDNKPYDKPNASAPGYRVYSSISNGGWAKFSGTSMATPHITGLVALIFQANNKLTVEEITGLITDTAKDIDEKGYDFNSGWGRADAFKVLSQIINTQLELPLP